MHRRSGWRDAWRRLAPGELGHVFFSDSGSVAVEVAMKAALQVWLNRGVRGRTRFLSFRGGYHGDTLATMSVCDPDEGMHRHFGAALAQQVIADLPRTPDQTTALAGLMRAHRETLAAVIVEPLVQGAGGMRMHPPEVLAEVARLTHAHGLLLIADEVFTGFGRTGAMFACEQAGLAPDLICLSKALTGGTMGLAATVATHEVFEAFWSDAQEHALMHGPTFMANPLACAAANASLDLFEREPRLAQARRIEARLAEGLAGLRGRPGVSDVRVLGAIGAVQLERDARSHRPQAAPAQRGCVGAAVCRRDLSDPGADHHRGRAGPSDRRGLHQRAFDPGLEPSCKSDSEERDGSETIEPFAFVAVGGQDD